MLQRAMMLSETTMLRCRRLKPDACRQQFSLPFCSFFNLLRPQLA